MSNTESVRLRAVVDSDRDPIRVIEDEPAGNVMSNVTARSDEQFDAHWRRVLADPCIVTRVVEVKKHETWRTAGFVTSFVIALDVGGELGQRRCVGYRLAQKWWGRGITTQALRWFLEDVEMRRPLWAMTAEANIASQRVLLKCGFEVIERRWTEATARYPAGNEFVVRLL